MNIQKVNVSGETAVTFTAFYPFIWIKNIGANDAYAANFSGFDAGDNDVACIPAGEAVRLDAMSNVVYIKSAGTTVYAHAQNVVESPFLDNFIAGGEAVIESLYGTYTATGGVNGYSPVSVTVPQTTVQSLSVTQNGTYTAPTGKAYSPVTVDVQEEPWAPLEDGYSNFWFELTDDTLSPWLNFSAKNADAVIDWGDGSGEQALDTLTPTHTYSKAGRYVVKVKGVTGIGAQHYNQLDDGYFDVLRYVELNNEVENYTAYAFAYCIQLRQLCTNSIDYTDGLFRYCSALEKVEAVTVSGNIPYALMQYCFKIKSFPISNNTISVGLTSIAYCFSLTSIVLPSTVTSLGNQCFNASINLAEIHIQATTPPTLGSSVFSALSSNFIIYVPTGTGETYKAAAGWSAYSDHILEEGQTITRAMQRKFAANALKGEETEIEEKR